MNTETILDNQSNDLVYLHFKNNAKDGVTLTKAKIIDRAVVGPKDPRKLIEVTYQIENQKETTFVFNYNKILREIEKGNYE